MMEKLKQFFENKIIPVTNKITNNRYIKILMDGFMGISAFTIGASFFSLARSLPLGDWYTNFLMSTGLYDILNFPIKITSDLSSLYLVIAFGYFTAKSFNKKPINGALIAFGSFLMLCPFETTATFTTEAGETLTSVVSDVLSVGLFGAQGIFLAMIVGILSVRIYVWFDDKNIKIKMPASVPSNVSNMFETMIPASIILVIGMVVRVLCSLTPYGTAQNLIYGLLQKPLTSIGGGYWGAFAFTFLSLVFWLFGIHGSMIMYVAMASIYQTMILENISAFANGLPCPNPEWYYTYFTNMGGSGATFGLCLLMAFTAKSEHLKTLGKLALPTSIFNINEPLLFGLPFIMNPIMAIPFLAAPTVNFFLTSLANKLGFAVLTGASVNNYLPVGVVGAFGTGNWEGFALSVVLIIVDIVIYYPFFKAYDNKKLEEEKLLAAGGEEEDDLL